MATGQVEDIAIRFHPRTTRRRRREIVERHGLGQCHLGDELVGERFHLCRVGDPSGALADLGCAPCVHRVARVKRHGTRRCVATDRIAIGFKGADHRALRRLVAQGARILERRDHEFLIRLAPGLDPEEVAADLDRLPSVAYAEPDYVLLGRGILHQASSAHLATAQPAARLIGAPAAWRLGRADPEVVIAVLDGGILTSHPDLRGTVVGAYDATGHHNPRPHPWDPHGTSCAALVVGNHRRARGVKGVAAGCGLLAVRIGLTPTRLADYLTKQSWIRQGIDWAWRHGAAVLSMSFGGGPPSRQITAAITRARIKGRGGRGCVLVAAAGNAAEPGAPVEYPASLASVIAVAATDARDRPQAVPTKANPWVSVSGAKVDIAAPGVGLYSATVPDPAGGSPALYTTDFSGTSAATPLVAGAAALVISANPGLTERQVRAILAATADKIKSVKFVDGRNDHVGAGRLSVAAAVRAAIR